jgi:hypothetical protein
MLRDADSDKFGLRADAIGATTGYRAACLREGSLVERTFGFAQPLPSLIAKIGSFNPTNEA